MPKTILLAAACLVGTGLWAQRDTAKARRPQHSLNVHYAFSYASDVSFDIDRGQRLPGIGYQYTSPKNWYIGIDVQYDQNRRPDYLLPATSPDGFYTYRSRLVPGGIGYFVAPQNLANFSEIITSDTIFKTPLADYPAVRNLVSRRLNVFLHAGRRWQRRKSQWEAGFTIQASHYQSVAALTSSVFVPIPASERVTDNVFFYLDGVTYLNGQQRNEFRPGAGLHLRYQLQLGKQWWVGVQALATASGGGVFAQAAPRLIYRLK